MNVTPHDILDRLKENKWNIVVSIAIVAALLVMVMGIRHAATQVSTVIPNPPSSTSSTVSPAVTELSKTLSTTQHQPQSHDVEQPSHEGMTNTEQRLSAIMEKAGHRDTNIGMEKAATHHAHRVPSHAMSNSTR